MVKTTDYINIIIVQGDDDYDAWTTCRNSGSKARKELTRKIDPDDA